MAKSTSMQFKLLFVPLSFFLVFALGSCCCREQVRVIRYVNYSPRHGDTLDSIAYRFGITPTEIEEINPNLESEPVIAGRNLKVPLSVQYYSASAVSSNGQTPCSPTSSTEACNVGQGIAQESSRASYNWEYVDRDYVYENYVLGDYVDGDYIDGEYVE